MTYTHTYALLSVTQACFEEIKGKLLAAGYDDALHDEGEGENGG